MAPKTTLNAKNLETLGATRLAELLIEISMGSAASKRRLRLELAGKQSVAEVAREVRKRLSSIERSRAPVRWNKVRALKTDLETQRLVISGTVAESDPDDAADLLWRFLDLADPIFARCDDSNGVILESFHAACADLGAIARQASNRMRLPEQVFSAIQRNDYGQYDPLIPAIAPALGSDGFTALKSLLAVWKDEPLETPVDRVVIGWGMSGPIYEDEIGAGSRESAIRVAFEQIADAGGDPDAFIAQQSEQSRTLPTVAADIARRLIATGRATEALAATDAAKPTGNNARDLEWQQARVAALEALGRPEDAQAFRWHCFEQQLSLEQAKAYVSRLPDFDDMEAEERIFAHVRGFENVHPALQFLIEWPAAAQAAKLVLARGDEIDGNPYELLTQAAGFLQDKHPLAATILLRAMIDFALENGRAGRYRHAARHLGEAGRLAGEITDFGAVPGHAAYVARLKAKYGRKHAFWSAVA